jgi:hypothetical protein
MYSRDLIASEKVLFIQSVVGTLCIIFGVNKDTVIRWLSDIQPSKHVRGKFQLSPSSDKFSSLIHFSD